jgi:hypothetical protein
MDTDALLGVFEIEGLDAELLVVCMDQWKIHDDFWGLLHRKKDDEQTDRAKQNLMTLMRWQAQELERIIKDGRRADIAIQMQKILQDKCNRLSGL